MNPTLQDELIIAINDRNLERMGEIIDLGAELNFKDEWGYSPLAHATYAGIEYVSLLIDKGAALIVDNDYQNSPLIMASLSKQYDIVKLILKRYPESQQILLESHGPLHVATRNLDRESAKALIQILEENQVELDYKPLHKAVEWNQTENVTALLTNSPAKDIHQQDGFGYTPLHLAVLNGHAEIAKLLLKHGADPYHKTKAGLNSFDLANQMGSSVMINTLMFKEVDSTNNIDYSIDASTYDSASRPLIDSWTFNDLISTVIDSSILNQNFQKNNMAQLLTDYGFAPVLKDINLYYLGYTLSYFDMAGIDFIHCHFNGKYNELHIKGKIEDSTFQSFECKNCQFEPGSVIENSTFRDSLINNVQFNDVTLNNNYFFYAGIKDSSFNHAHFNNNYFYGSQIWNVNLDNVNFYDTKIVESEIANTSLPTQVEVETRTKPIIGILGEISELGDYSNPGFFAAEPYLRIKQSGAIPYLMPRNNLYEKINFDELSLEIDQVIGTIDKNNPPSSIAQFVLHAELPQIKMINEVAQDFTQYLDGVWIPGGPDIDRGFYDLEYQQYSYHKGGDLLEFALVDQMLAKNKPVLGVCHGAQLINVYLGGTLLQHVPGQHGMQEVQILNHKGHMGEVLNGDIVRGYSNHHQAIDRIAEPLEIVAKYDGIIKAAQGKELPLYLTQFHPEYMLDDNNAAVLKSFFDAAKKTVANEPLQLNEVLHGSVLADSTSSQPIASPLNLISPVMTPDSQPHIEIIV